MKEILTSLYMYNANVFDKRRDWHRHYNRPFEIHAVQKFTSS